MLHCHRSVCWAPNGSTQTQLNSTVQLCNPKDSGPLPQQLQVATVAAAGPVMLSLTEPV
jgi:hypothetical protein